MLKVAYVATSRNSGLYNIEQLLSNFGYNHTRLGFGTKWKGWKYRIELYHKFVSSLPADTLVCLIDAYDVLPLRPYDETKIYELYNSFQTPIIGGAEHVCYANCQPLLSPPPNTKNQFINGGFTIGKSQYLTQMYAEMLLTDFTDDQIRLAQYVNDHPDLVSLDCKNQFVYNDIADSHHIYNYQDAKCPSSSPQVVSSIHLQDKSHRIISPFFLHAPGSNTWPYLMKLNHKTFGTTGPYYEVGKTLLQSDFSEPHMMSSLAIDLTLFSLYLSISVASLCILLFCYWMVRYSYRRYHGAKN